MIDERKVAAQMNIYIDTRILIPEDDDAWVVV